MNIGFPLIPIMESIWVNGLNQTLLHYWNLFAIKILRY